MPTELKQQIAAAFKRAVASPTFASKLPIGIQAAYASSDEFSKQIQSEQSYYKQLIASLNLKIQ
ncbi:hypothetical protein D9M68_734720 [compost metagenome]